MLSVFVVLVSIYRLIESTCTVRSDVPTTLFTNPKWDDSGTRPTLVVESSLRNFQQTAVMSSVLWTTGIAIAHDIVSDTAIVDGPLLRVGCLAFACAVSAAMRHQVSGRI